MPASGCASLATFRCGALAPYDSRLATLPTRSPPMSAPTGPRPLMEYLAEIPDPRVELKCLHDLIDVIMIVTCGTIVGADDFVSIAEFARAKEGWLRERLGLKLRSGIPSHDTLNRVFAIIRPEA